MKNALKGCDRPLKGELGRAEDRPVAARLILEGTTPLHGDLHERSVHWVEEFRGVAASLLEVWLEKTLFHTRKRSSIKSSTLTDSPSPPLIKAVDSLKFGQRRPHRLIPRV